MEGLYKMKKNGLGDRTVRAKAKEMSSKTKRADLLATKRRIPLGVLEVDDEKAPKKQTAQVDAPKPIDRLERLKEWKKQREEARAKKDKENQKKPPPFRCGNSGRPPHTKLEHTSSRKQPAVFTMGVGPVKAKPLQPVTNAVSSSKTTKIKPATKAPATRARTSSAKPINPSATTRTSTRLAAKQKKEASAKPKPTTSRPQTRSATKSAKKGTTSVVDKKAPVAHKAASKPASSKAKKSKKVDPEPMAEEEVAPERVKPNTPAKSHLPVTPSPLLKSQRRKAPVRYVDHPAWIPNNMLTPKMTDEPNFDQTPFSPFTPFKFTADNVATGSTNKFAFTFKKDIPTEPLNLCSIHPDSLDEDSLNESTSGSERVTPNPKLLRKSLGKSRSAKRSSRHITKYDEDDIVVRVLDMDNEEPMESTEGPITPLVIECGKDQIDVAYFRGLHSGVTEKLLELCQVWNDKTEALEYEEADNPSGGNMEEVLGQIRTTVCQAQLLMRQKLKQYLGLVGEAETQSGERKTTAEDLQGFWDMVFFQVEELYKKFDDLEKLEKNGWQHKMPTPKKRKGKKRQAAAKKSTTASDAATNERLQAAREKREAERNRLKEMRMAAKRAREQEKENDGVQQLEETETHVTPKKSKHAGTPRSSSTSRHRRRSQRLMHKSVFSPSRRSPVCENVASVEVPTAMLLDL